MAALSEGQAYGLSSNTAAGIGKTVVYLKLTDSALKSIDEYQLNQRTSKQKPSIRFKGNNGVIQIPCRSSNHENGFRSYNLTLSQLQGDPNGSFDCVQQDTNSFDNDLELIGSMVHKITVLAGDDIYQATRVKMTQAEEASKKICTKEIKPGSQFRSKKVKKVLKPNELKLPETAEGSPNSRVTSGLPKLPTTTSSSQPSRPTANVAPTQRTAVHSLHKKLPNTRNVLNQTGANNRMISNSQNNKQPPNSAVLNKPYRDRIIHLLAVRPYKKPELLARLHRDGIREKDKNSLGTILQQVAALNPRDNTFSLAKHMYTDVQSDWPFYTELDKQLLKRRMPSTPTHSPNVSPSQSASPSSSQNSQNCQHSQKRPSSNESSLPAKKAKLADSSNRHTHHNGTIKQEADISQSRKENQHLISNTRPESVANSTSDSSDFINHYIVIRSADQRHKYKADFNSEYDEYRELHSSVEAVSKRFAQLEEIFRKAPEGSKDYENIKDKILHEYKTLKNDPKFVKQKKRFDYLHRKLSHIKKLILEYDQSVIQLHDS